MGSWANSIHVRTTDTKGVIATIQAAMQRDGYEPIDEMPDEEQRWESSQRFRGLHICDAQRGWIGILDSDPMNADSLLADLSRDLETHAIQFFVNDSDAWYYQLYGQGTKRDEFGSVDPAEAGFAMGLSAEEVVEAISGVDMSAIESELKRRMEELVEQTQNDVPENIRSIRERIEQRCASSDEHEQYRAWVQSQHQQVMHAVNEIAFQVASSAGVQAPPPGKQDEGEGTVTAHVDQLRPILADGAADENVVEVLGKRAVFAETVLGEFLELVAINPFFANLSYDYIEREPETRDELPEQGITLIAHLGFKRDENKDDCDSC